jgi:antitoxin component YwqK of YwqJK toxin-antitoxin module
MKYSGNCINGKVDGLITYYHITGKIDAQGQYVNDVKHGPWNYYKEDGTVLRTDTYVNGKMTSSTDTNKDRDVITKEKQEEEKRQYEHFEVIDPFQEGYQPQR